MYRGHMNDFGLFCSNYEVKQQYNPLKTWCIVVSCCSFSCIGVLWPQEGAVLCSGKCKSPLTCSSWCLCSFGMVLTKGHGQLMFVGNVSVEEGMVSHNALRERPCALLSFGQKGAFLTLWFYWVLLCLMCF